MRSVKLVACILFFVIIFHLESNAKTIIVDKTGLGDYTEIQDAVDIAGEGDSVKVMPGVYNGQIVIRKNIVLQGSGYETTHIVSHESPTIEMFDSKIMWFSISSNTGTAINMSGGFLTNNVIWNSPGNGVYFKANTVVQNCVFINLGTAIGASERGTLINCIIIGSDFWGGTTPTYLYCRVDGSSYDIGCIDDDPQFPSETDFMLSATSPCWDTGKPDIYDPDGSRSDMGYYGGPDAPVLPVVSDLRIFLNADGTVNVQATAQSRY